MIDIAVEKDLALDAQERYDIISFAMQAADDNGFINSFVFERALYCYAAIMLFQERKEELASLVAGNPLICWKQLIEDGTLEEMKNGYSRELETLSREGDYWYQEYADWAHSARGILDVVQDFTGDFVQNAATRLQETAESTGVTQLLQTTEEWGMGRVAPTEDKPDIKVIKTETDNSTLFE